MKFWESCESLGKRVCLVEIVSQWLKCSLNHNESIFTKLLCLSWGFILFENSQNNPSWCFGNCLGLNHVFGSSVVEDYVHSRETFQALQKKKKKYHVYNMKRVIVSVRVRLHLSQSVNCIVQYGSMKSHRWERQHGVCQCAPTSALWAYLRSHCITPVLCQPKYKYLELV